QLLGVSPRQVGSLDGEGPEGHPVEGLSHDQSVPISGIDSLEVLNQNLEIACSFKPLSAGAMQQLRDRCRPDAADVRWELFKTTKKYDGNLGRDQHGFPSAAELPA